MRITDAKVRAVGHGLALALASDRDETGIGEASPLAPFSIETIDGAARSLEGIARRLGAFDEEAPIDRAIAAAFEAGASSLAGSARFAVETALADLIAKRRGVPLHVLLADGAPNAEVALNALAVADPVETLVDRVRALVQAGATSVKIKLRSKDDRGFLRELDALRAIASMPVALRLDPNAAWSLDEARARLDALAAVRPEYVEQPVRARDLPSLGKAAVPWAADESLALPGVARAILDAPAGCAAFVIKPQITGMLSARDLARRARERGIAVVITHLFDGPVGHAAASALALALGTAPCGLAPHARLAEYPPIAPPHLGGPFVLRAPRRIGLGFSHEEEGAWIG